MFITIYLTACLKLYKGKTSICYISLSFFHSCIN